MTADYQQLNYLISQCTYLYLDDSNNFLLPDPPDLDTELDHVTPEHKHALPILHSNQQQESQYFYNSPKYKIRNLC